MKPLSYYQKISISYPNKKQYEKVYFYKKGRLIGIKEQFDVDFIEPENCAKEVIFDEVSYQAHLKLYQDESMRLQNEFRNDLIEKYKMTGHSKASKCFDMAWDFGQSSSYDDVEDYFMNLINLIDMDNQKEMPPLIVGGGTSNPYNLMAS